MRSQRMTSLDLLLSVTVKVFMSSPIQEVVDDMSLAGCSNLNGWVKGLDGRVEGVLAKRLEKVRLVSSPGTPTRTVTHNQYK